MNISKTFALSAIALAGVLTLGTGAAFAQTTTKQGAAATAPAKANISLVQAINVAEGHANGRAVSAELESGKDKSSYYEIKVVAPDKSVHKVEVDAVSGKVLSSERKERRDRN